MESGDGPNTDDNRDNIRPIGRGRLGSMDLVPEAGQDDIVWAIGELNQRNRTQSDIRDELNGRLDAKGIEPISKSAFNRRAVKLAALKNRIELSRHIFEGIADQFTPEKVDENNIVLGEIIKILILELTEEGQNTTPKQAMELSRAFLASVQAQKISADRRAKIERDYADKATKAVDAVAKTKGLTAETADTIKRELLGIRS